MAFFRLFVLEFRLFVWRVSLFRLFAWRYFVVFVFSHGVISSFRLFVWRLLVFSFFRVALFRGEKTKRRKDEMAQTSHHRDMITLILRMRMGERTKVNFNRYSISGPIFVATGILFRGQVFVPFFLLFLYI